MKSKKWIQDDGSYNGTIVPCRNLKMREVPLKVWKFFKNLNVWWTFKNKRETVDTFLNFFDLYEKWEWKKSLCFIQLVDPSLYLVRIRVLLNGSFDPFVPILLFFSFFTFAFFLFFLFVFSSFSYLFIYSIFFIFISF